MAHVVILQIDLAQDSQDLAELKVKASSSDSFPQIKALYCLGVDVPLEFFSLLFQFFLKL